MQWAGLVMGEATSAAALADSAALGAVFVMERAFSGLSVASFPCAKGTGLAAAFADSAQKKTVRFWLAIWLAACFFVLIVNAGWAGIGTGMGAGLVFIWYYQMAKEKFGGITGDLAGWFLQVCELVCLMILTVGIGIR